MPCSLACNDISNVPATSVSRVYSGCCGLLWKKKSFYLYPKLHGVTSIRNLYTVVRTSNPYRVFVTGVVVLDVSCLLSRHCRNSGLLTHFQNAWSDPPHFDDLFESHAPFVKRGLADRVMTITAVELRQPNFSRRARDGTTVS